MATFLFAQRILFAFLLGVSALYACRAITETLDWSQVGSYIVVQNWRSEKKKTQNKSLFSSLRKTWNENETNEAKAKFQKMAFFCNNKINMCINYKQYINEYANEL